MVRPSVFLISSAVGGQMMVGWVVVSCDPKGQTHPVGPNLLQPTRKLNPSSRPKLDLWTNTDIH